MPGTILGYDQESVMTQVEIVFKPPGVMRNTQINTKKSRQNGEMYVNQDRKQWGFLAYSSGNCEGAPIGSAPGITDEP